MTGALDLTLQCQFVDVQIDTRSHRNLPPNRSQISTVVLAAARNPFWVTIGAILGHALCTGGAVLGGKMIASRISVKNGGFPASFLSITSHSPILAVTFAGAVLFIIFGLWTIGERLQLFGPLDEGEA